MTITRRQMIAVFVVQLINVEDREIVVYPFVAPVCQEVESHVITSRINATSTTKHNIDYRGCPMINVTIALFLLFTYSRTSHSPQIEGTVYYKSNEPSHRLIKSVYWELSS